MTLGSESEVVGDQNAFDFCFSPLIMLLERTPLSESKPFFTSHEYY